MKNRNLILSALMILLSVVLYSCSHDEAGLITSPDAVTDEQATPDYSEGGNNPDEVGIETESDHHGVGFVYIQTNDATQNGVLIYRQAGNGNLNLVSTVNTGGQGTGGGLGNQGAVNILKSDWLFAVNAGSSTLSSFKIAHNGNLILKDTEETNGKLPVSVTSHGRFVYVVNAGSDNISGFRVMNNGSLNHIPNSTKQLSASGVGAAQISFSPNGRYLYVTEKATDKITMFPVGNNGVAGDGSPVNSTGQTPFGFEIARDRYLIVSNAAGGAPGLSSATSYSGINSGNISPVNGAVGNNQAAACWVATTRHGRFAYVTNTASDNISSYYVAPTGRLFLINPDIDAGDGPTEIIVSKNNAYVHALNAAENTITSYRRLLLGNLLQIGTTTGVPAGATGIAAR